MLVGERCHLEGRTIVAEPMGGNFRDRRRRGRYQAPTLIEMGAAPHIAVSRTGASPTPTASRSDGLTFDGIGTRAERRLSYAERIKTFYGSGSREDMTRAT